MVRRRLRLLRPRNQRVTQAVARLLHRAGVDFGIPTTASATPVTTSAGWGGGLFEHLVEANLGALGECDFSTVMTSDPHSLNTLLNEYPGREGAHHTTFLANPIADDRLTIEAPLGGRATYHGPCLPRADQRRLRRAPAADRGRRL